MPINDFNSHPLSWYPNKERLNRPLYKSLLHELKAAIEDGSLLPGTMLPPQRELADYLDVNFTTITRVYKLSAQLGLTYGITGKGTYVSPSGIDPLTINTSPQHLIDLGFIASYEQTNYLLDKTLRKVASLGASQLLTYASPTGRDIDKAAFRQYLTWLGHPLLPEQNVLVTAGGENSLSLLLNVIFSPGDLIAVDEFTYSNFIATAKLNGVRLIAIKNDEQGMIPAELERICKLNNINGLYIIPEYNNPTGRILDSHRRQEIAQIAKHHQLKIIEDDYLSFLSKANPARPPKIFQLLPQQTFYVCSMSKVITSGLRVAYLAYPKSMGRQVENGFFNTTVKTSTLNTAIATNAIQSGVAKKIIQEKINYAQKMNSIFNHVFPFAPTNELTNNVFFRRLPLKNSRKSGKDIEKELLSRHLRCFHSQRFSVAATTNESFLRVSLSATNSRDELLAGLKKLREYLGEKKLI
ncbi:PLP-dependent aminotransferase family protein [Limosilactobacillus sp. STM2_1]|uniref:PLP-dependent aminotransferase family protein n=1 Tax=Limosilactobacillus rudii TaxID=2759755 RepID=A0A7W3UL57_9LACO|nr:PLP-dependent aminotransferase family protein [Limosilactobacillus rudii]MBB1079570.1 PLP-dependent aminotransferase family protein [Limosilactobacillus rudii]MBB1097616.1 PLP-dependent aminotransferase family protein [Limosilactobacillus rudii]MCD7134725.1 PLP-dependent aminotransferase family protein [Limosilactobacillus rudii]